MLQYIPNERVDSDRPITLTLTLTLTLTHKHHW